jgi:hypothetical protein
MKHADVRDMLKKASKSVYTSTTVTPPGPLSPNPSISSAMKTPKHAEQDPDNPVQGDEGDIQMQHSPNIGTLKKIICKNLAQCRPIF